MERVCEPWVEGVLKQVAGILLYLILLMMNIKLLLKLQVNQTRIPRRFRIHAGNATPSVMLIILYLSQVSLCDSSLTRRVSLVQNA